MKIPVALLILLDILFGMCAAFLAVLQSAAAFGDTTMIVTLVTIPVYLAVGALLLRQKSRGHRIFRSIIALLSYPAMVWFDSFRLYNTVSAFIDHGDSGSYSDAGSGILLVYIIIPGAWFLILIASRIAARLSRPGKETS